VLKQSISRGGVLVADTYFDLFLGYTIIWALIAVYVMRLMGVLRALKMRLDRVEHKLKPKQ
jgi:CcmD family protein